METGDLGIAVAGAIRIDDCCILLAGKLQSLPLVEQDRTHLLDRTITDLPEPGTAEHANAVLSAARGWLGYKIGSGLCSVWSATLDKDILIDKRALQKMDYRSLIKGCYVNLTNDFAVLTGRSLWIKRRDLMRLAQQIMHERYSRNANFKLENSARTWIDHYPLQNSKNAWAHYQDDVEYPVSKMQFDAEWREVKGHLKRGRPPKSVV